jgi:hypothetical protein
MPESKHPTAMHLMALGGPDSLDSVTPSFLDMQGGPVLLRFTSRSSAPMAMLNNSPALLDTLASVLTAHESSLSLTS